jgi:hypothetical protein
MLAEHLQAGFVARRFSTTWTRLVFGLFGPIIPTRIFPYKLLNKFHYWFVSQISLNNSRDRECGEKAGQWPHPIKVLCASEDVKTELRRRANGRSDEHRKRL